MTYTAPPSGCPTCGSKTRIHPDGYVYRPHASWCPNAPAPSPTARRFDPYTIPGTACRGCGTGTRGGDLCPTCRPIAINAITHMRSTG